MRDLAEAHLLALGALSDAKSRLIYNIGNGQGFTVREVIDSVRRVTGRPIAVEELDAQTRRSSRSGGKFGEDQNGVGLAAEVRGAGPDYLQRLGVASKTLFMR